VLNGSITVVPKSTFFDGRTFSLSQAAARVFAGSNSAHAAARATCVGSSCFDSIFDSGNSRSSVDTSSTQSFSLFMNYDNATKAARTAGIPLDLRGQNNHNFAVTCIDCWAFVSASITFAASLQVITDDAFPPAQFQAAPTPTTIDNVKLLIL
jgi:hypothetical protein